MPMTIFDVLVRYAKEMLFYFAAARRWSGSSRDWAAKGPKLLGVCVVIAESYERIHRSNLVGMGILPLQFKIGQNVASLGLTGEQVFDRRVAELLGGPFATGKEIDVQVTALGHTKTFKALVRIDTPQESTLLPTWRHFALCIAAVVGSQVTEKARLGGDIIMSTPKHKHLARRAIRRVAVARLRNSKIL
jgi:aconitase A